MNPTKVLAAIALFSLVTVELGGWSLLRFLNSSTPLTKFQEQFFRAGHAHAGVLLVLALVYFVLLDRTAFSGTTQWAAGATLMVGILLQSGGFFVHMLVGEARSGSVGTVITTVGAAFLAVALVTLGIGLLRAGSAP